MGEFDAIIVGGGLSGLACALRLQEGGARPLILEAGDGIGGRVRTDEQEGFLLDRGFQVLLEAYPECRRLLDYEALELRPFFPGAEIWTGKGFTRFSDPYRRPQDAVATLASPIGTFSDKLKVTALRRAVLQGGPNAPLEGPDRTALQELEDLGFSRGMIQAFFRPFFGGVLLSPDLSDSSRIFRYIFRMFSAGAISIPRRGMGQIPAQLAGRLPRRAIRLNSRVSAVEAGRVTLASGEAVSAEAVVVATEGPEAARLLPGLPSPSSKGTACLYFEVPEPPRSGPVLVLNGEGEGPVNNLAVLSEVSRDLAPPGRHFLSASCIGDLGDTPELLESAVRAQMVRWFGGQVREWRHLRTYRISHAQPGQSPGVLDPVERPVRMADGVFVCGDHRETASLQGALHSGKRAAEAVLAERAS